MSLSPTNTPGQPQPAVGSPLMARAALGLSIVAFIIPFGIAAIVMGHIAESRIESSPDSLNGKATARAALWIAYLQLALLSLTVLVLWGIFHDTAQGFRQDAMVQRAFRANDQIKPLDSESARDAEGSALTILNQLIAIEDQIRRHRDDGGYTCRLSEVIDTGLEGTTDAEKRTFDLRVAQSPYAFALSHCNPSNGGIPSAAYVLTAIPRPPRMPEGSAIFCTDQTGVVRSVRGGTSLDCLDHGQPVQ